MDVYAPYLENLFATVPATPVSGVTKICVPASFTLTIVPLLFPKGFCTSVNCWWLCEPKKRVPVNFTFVPLDKGTSPGVLETIVGATKVYAAGSENLCKS